MMVLIMSKIKKVELSPIYLRKDDDVGATYCSFSKDLIFNVGYEKIKDLTLEKSPKENRILYYPEIENQVTYFNDINLPSSYEIRFTLEIFDANGVDYLTFKSSTVNTINVGRPKYNGLYWILEVPSSFQSSSYVSIPLNEKVDIRIVVNERIDVYSGSTRVGIGYSTSNPKLTKLTMTEGRKITNFRIIDTTKIQSYNENFIKKNKTELLNTTIKGEKGNKLQGVDVNFVADDNVDINDLRIIATKRVIKSGGKTTFHISVLDENNNPIPNVFIELIDSD